MSRDSQRTKAVLLLDAFEKCVIVAAHQLARPQDHFKVEELRSQLLAELSAGPEGDERQLIATNAYNAALHEALECYSPDDSATDWSDKIRSLKRSSATSSTEGEKHG